MKNKNVSAQRSNSNTVWFNFQTYKKMYIYKKCIYIVYKYLVLT